MIFNHADHFYGVQACKEHAGDPPVWAQRLAPGYAGEGTTFEVGDITDESTVWREIHVI
jgi:glyoxylase-like metal-dependent hydrolase (beta-lactamase superfamily II)